MKRLLKPIALWAIAVAGAVGCHKAEMPFDPDMDVPQVEEPTALFRYTFDIAEDITRATLSNDGAFWEAGDMVGIYLGGVDNDEAEINMDTSPKTVILRSENPISAGTVAYAYYPFDETNTDLTATRFNIPNQQTGGDVSAMPMAGVPFTIETGGATSTNGQIYFMNLGSIIDFQVYSATYTGETVEYITFQADGINISGDGILNLSAVNPSLEETLAFSSWSETHYDYVTVRQSATVAATKDGASSIFMVLAPGSYASGTITIGTDAATYTFNFTGKALARNELKHYTMNLDNATRVETVVKSTFPYSETFLGSIGDFVIDGGTGNEWTFVANYGAKANGRYKDSDNTIRNHDVNTSLVSPWIDLRSVQGATLSFEHAINSYIYVEDDDAAAVYIMKEGEASWSRLQVDFPDKPQNDYSSFLTVTKDISAYIGHRVKIQFTYKSTTVRAGTWEIRNFVVDQYVPTPVYELYSGSLTEGDYVIYFNGKAMKNTVTSNRLDYTEVTPSNSKIEGPDASIVWHIAKSGSYWTIYNAAAGKYAAGTGNKSQAQLLTSGTDDKSLWSVSGSSTYDFVNKYNTAQGVNASLRENTTYGFACYASTATGVPTLYKLSSGSSSGSGSGGGETPSPSVLPGHLGCFEVPYITGGVSAHAEGTEVLGTTKWHRWNTTDSHQKVVTHTFYNDYVYPSKSMRSYTLLQDYDKKCALWVACAMNNDVYPKAVARKEKWCYDPALDDDWQPNLSNSYPDKGGYSYDRGHQLAASYRETTLDQVKMTCYFTNMTPQLSKLNQGKWQNSVEANVRDLGESTSGRDTLYVVSGPLFIGSSGTVEDKDGMSCARPSHYFQCFMKVSFGTNGSVLSAKGAAYLVEHVVSPTVQYVTIDYVESLTDDGHGNHFDFFANVPTAIQDAAEATATSIASF